MTTTTQKATLAGGCFWCLEAVFNDLKGVLEVKSGYTGGHIDSPSYKQVCTGTTGHAEVVQVTYDPEVITYEDLLNVFFAIHDPTTPNRQGADIGTQYRSEIFTHDETQEMTAEQKITELNNASLWDSPIVTNISSLENFWVAEEYHQEYFANNPNQPYCQAVVAPKVVKFRKQFIEKLKK